MTSALPAFLRRRPPPESLRWAERAVGPGARVVSVRRLRGGLSTTMHAVDVVDRRGTRCRLALRRFVRADWLEREPDLAEREARVLRLLQGSGLPTPELIAVDPDGRATGVPALLMTRLPGRVDFAPKDMASWLRRMAEPLPRIHAVEPPEDVQPYRTYNTVSELDVPSWSTRPEAWAKALEILRGRPPDGAKRFVHRDYHPGNVLWSRGRLTGIVDWINASVGPPQVDIGHCRMNLVKLYGVEVADQFLEACRAAGGPAADYSPYWDLVSPVDILPIADTYKPWADVGVRHLTTRLVRQRLDEYVARAVAGL